MGIDDERFYHVLSGFLFFNVLNVLAYFYFFLQGFFGSVDYAAEELRWRQVVISSCAAWRRAASID